MDFLEKLYSNENFGLYLVIAIAVLVVLFFIVLFLGKKDEKKTKEIQEAKEKEKALVENNATGPVPIEPIGEALNNAPQPVSVAPVSEVAPAPIVTPAPEVTPVLNSTPAFKEVTEPVAVQAPVQATPEETSNVVLNEGLNAYNEEESDETKEFDFEALADAINKELESIKESKVEAPVMPEPKVEEKPVIEEKPFAFPTFETVEPDKIPEQIVKPEVKPVIPEKPKMPDVFSSVYANPKEEKKEVVKPINKPAPFELPKMADLPKKAEEKPLETKEVPSFLDQIEAESYQIDK